MFNRTKSLKKQLSVATARLRASHRALDSKHKGGELEEYRSAIAEVLRLERDLSASRDEPYAISCQFPVQWDIGAPLPILMCNDNKTFLTFYIDEPCPDWYGTYVTSVDPASPEPASLCLVTFNGCLSSKLGTPNDEGQGGHALAGKGLEGYTAQIVVNSPWLAEVAKAENFRCESLNHYVFWFHDSTFECLAESFNVEVCFEPMSTLLDRVQAKLLK
ncbi:MAG: hypothetical protein KKA60_06965 [Proteobacteria bacterium]|nr:hypothetical protein [Pseudomonadota bacterium]